MLGNRRKSPYYEICQSLVVVLIFMNYFCLLNALKCHNCITQDYNQDEDDYEECLPLNKLTQRLEQNKQLGGAAPVIKISESPAICIEMETQVTNKDGDVMESTLVRTQVDHGELSHVFLQDTDVSQFCDDGEGSLQTFQKGSEEIHIKVCGCTTDLCNGNSGGTRPFPPISMLTGGSLLASSLISVFACHVL